jgi:hypothetical protein
MHFDYWIIGTLDDDDDGFNDAVLVYLTHLCCAAGVHGGGTSLPRRRTSMQSSKSLILRLSRLGDAGRDARDALKEFIELVETTDLNTDWDGVLNEAWKLLEAIWVCISNSLSPTHSLQPTLSHSTFCVLTFCDGCAMCDVRCAMGRCFMM